MCHEKSKKILVGKPQYLRLRRRCEDSITIDLKRISVRVWIGFIQLKIGSSGEHISTR
jgi:hypothetical protein